MSETTPYETLGVTEEASFEEIQSAKQRLNQQHQGNTQVLETIEEAYDAIIMERLRLRKEGKIAVPEGIRRPEKAATSTVKQNAPPLSTPPAWLQDLMDNPTQKDVLLPGAIFFGLCLLTIFSQTGDVSFFASLLAIGGMASVYFVNRKENRFGRAILINLIALALGIGLGYGLDSLLTVPWGAEQLSCFVTFVFFWIASSFLR